MLTFLGLCQLESHLLFLSVLYQHVVASVSLRPNVSALHIPLALLLVSYCVVVGINKTFWLLHLLVFVFLFCLILDVCLAVSVFVLL
jgi:hypothetical protein